MKLRFSQSALTKYFGSLDKNRRNSRTQVKLPRCLECNPQNRTEMTCVMCGNTKSLDLFAKAQRRKTDDAVSHLEQVGIMLNHDLALQRLSTRKRRSGTRPREGS